MPLYGIRQSGGNVDATLNVVSLVPGDQYTMFDGTEAPGAAVSSVAFSRGYNPGGGYAPLQFTIQFAAAPTAVVLVQGSNSLSDAAFVTLFTSTNKQVDSYSDSGQFAFYRFQLSTYTSGGMPVCQVQR